jgi:hypothetical protein
MVDSIATSREKAKIRRRADVGGCRAEKRDESVLKEAGTVEKYDLDRYPHSLKAGDRVARHGACA